MNILRNRLGWAVFMLPALVFYAAVVLLPILQSLFLSLFSWNGITPSKFVWLENYAQLLGDRFFWTAVQHNIVYVAAVVTVQVLGGLLLAILLVNIRLGQNVMKTLFYVPVIVVTVAVAQMFRNIYSFQPEGLLNLILSSIGLGEFRDAWLSNPNTALLAVSIPEGWRFIGLYMIIFHAALLSIPREIEEAACLDGVNEWQMNWSIRIPYIRHIIVLSIIMATTGALRGFDIPYIISAPATLTELVTTYMYKKAFSSLQYGYGSAIAVFIIVECILFVLVVRAIGKMGRRESRT